MKPSLSIRGYLLVLAAAAALPLLLMLGYTVYAGAVSSVEVARTTARTMAIITASDTDRVLRTNREVMERIARRPLIQTAAIGHCDGFLDDFHATFPSFANATVINPDGVAVCSAVPQPGGKPVNVAKAEWFRRAVAEQRFVVGRPFLGPITGRWVSVLILPVKDDGGRLSGYLGFPLDLAAYQPGISNVVLEKDTTVGILDNAGTVIWRNLEAEAMIGKNVADNPTTRRILAGEAEFSGIGIDGIDRVYFVERLAEVDWRVFIGVPQEALYARARQTAWRNFSVGAALLLAVLSLGFGIAHLISVPVRTLAGMAARIRQGEFDLRAPLAGPRELVEVAREFNAMVAVREAQTRELVKREEELQQSNQELEQFAYIASHDLREPLRMISSYLGLIEKRIGGGFDEELKRYFAYATGGAKRMNQLILDLLEYSRTGRMASPHETLAIGEVVAEALLHLSPAIEKAGALVTVADPLPRLWASRSEMLRLFGNLIGNAVKYRHPDRRPEIDIACRQEAGQWIISVRDNGIGIAAQHRERAFKLFQRLVGRDEYEGTGIGLAVCKKVVEAHGGRIWIEDSPGGGCIFLVALPAGESR